MAPLNEPPLHLPPIEAALGVDAQNEGAVILFTTDGGDTGYMTRGSLNDSSVYTVGDGECISECISECIRA